MRLFATVDRELGRVSALVNNAGTLEIQSRVEAIDAARLQRIFNTNVVGSFLCAREAVKRMSTKHGGKAAVSSMFLRSPRFMEPPANTWIMPPAKARSTALLLVWPARSRRKVYA